MWIYLCTIAISYFLYYKYSSKPHYKLPPGPPQLPVIGSLLAVALTGAKRPVDIFEKFSKTYGDVFSLQMGSVTTVVINGYEKLTQVVNSEYLLSHIDESDSWLLEKTWSLPLGLLLSLPDFWSKTRAFTHKTLRKYGFSEKTTTGRLVVEEFVDFCDDIASQMHNGRRSITITSQFSQVFFNIIYTIITGEKCDRKDTRLQTLLEAMNAYVKSGKLGGSVAFIYPQLVPIFPKLTGFQNLRKVCSTWRVIIQALIADVRGKPGNNDEPRNFLQEYLHHVDDISPPPDPLSSIYSEENLVGVLQDLFLGGTDTAAHLLKFLLRFLLQYPEVQEKLSREVDKVVGKHGNVTIEDIPKLLYVQATLYELYRITNVALATPRKLLDDWCYDNYVIPKGSTIILNIWSGNLDKSVWTNPTTFDPTRFISPDGVLMNTEKILSFGFGKRKCIGEQLAKTSMVLAVTTLIQRFKFEIDPVTGPPSNDDIHSFTRDTVPFNVVFIAKK